MIQAVSFYMNNINPDVVYYQRQVVEKFCDKIKFNQILTGKNHADSMTDYMKSVDSDYVIFLDIDAIPLCEESFSILIDMTHNGAQISGAPQRSNHISNDEHIFVAPAIMCMPTKLYKLLGSPSAKNIRGKGDVAEEWTYAQEANGGSVNFLDVDSFDPVPGKKWYLKGTQEFGRNTVYTYQGKRVFFHSYQGRFKEQQERFVEECKKVL